MGGDSSASLARRRRSSWPPNRTQTPAGGLEMEMKNQCARALERVPVFFAHSLARSLSLAAPAQIKRARSIFTARLRKSATRTKAAGGSPVGRAAHRPPRSRSRAKPAAGRKPQEQISSAQVARVAPRRAASQSSCCCKMCVQRDSAPSRSGARRGVCVWRFAIRDSQFAIRNSRFTRKRKRRAGPPHVRSRQLLGRAVRPFEASAARRGSAREGRARGEEPVGRAASSLLHTPLE